MADELVPTPERLARLYSLVGLKPGGDTPAASALSITAELQAVLSRREGVHLRQHGSPVRRAHPKIGPGVASLADVHK